MIPTRLSDIVEEGNREEELYFTSDRLWSGDSGDGYETGIIISLEHRNTELPYNIWIKSKENGFGVAETIAKVNGTDIDTEPGKVSPENNWYLLGSHKFSKTVMNTHNIAITTPFPVEDLYLTNTDSPPPSNAEKFERSLYGFPRESLGASNLSPDRAEILSENLFELVYEVGKQGISKKGGIIVGIPWGTFPAPYWEGLEKDENYQMIREGGPWGGPESDSFLSATTMKSDLELDLLQFWKYSFATREYLVRISLTENLQNGDIIRVKFGREEDKVRLGQCFPYHYDENEKIRWYSPTVPMRVLVDPNGQEVFAPLSKDNSHEFEVISGREKRAINSTSNFGSKPRLKSAVYTDTARNPKRSTGSPREFSIDFEKSKGYDGEKYSAILPFIDSEGSYSGGFANPVLTGKPDSEFNIYWGEIHGHSGIDDGMRSLEEYFKHAKDFASLDFTAMSPHSEYVNDQRWEKILERVNDLNEPGNFVTLNGFEWTSPEGHKNIYTTSDKLPLFRYTDQDIEGRGFDKFWNQLEEKIDQKVIVIPHHTLDGHDWKNRSPEIERLIEIYSMWGSSEYKDNPLWDKTQEGPSVREILDRGARLGFTAGSDTHHASPGLSPDPEGTKSRYGNLKYKNGIFATLSKNLTRDSIFKSLKNRRTFATTGERGILLLRANGKWMGSSIQDNELELEIFCAGTDKIKKIEIVKDREATQFFKPKDYFFEKTFNLEDRNGNYLYTRAIQENGEIIWSSPIFPH